MICAIENLVGHVAEVESTGRVLALLRHLHGPAYQFGLGRWAGDTTVAPQAGRTSHRFVIAAESGMIRLEPGALVRGYDPAGPYRQLAPTLAEVAASHSEPVWPGDVIVVDERQPGPVRLMGQGIYFEVTTPQTAYRAPQFAGLRHLPDYPGGCAAYPGAFRREALPPERAGLTAADQQGCNRVNEHTLDMRYDRSPAPIRHYHGPVPAGSGRLVNHSETAIVLPRSLYGLPEVGPVDQGHLVLYPRPAEDASDKVVIPVRPGSIVVTPASPDAVAGHCFENVLAMLIAIPGFVAPYHFIETAEARP
jgi:hypothetical protein